MRPDWSVYLITDRHQLSDDDLVGAVGSAVSGGVSAVQLREKDLPLRDLLALAQRIKSITERNGTALLINGRIDVMLAVNADGVHLPSDGLPTRVVRRIIGSTKLLGVSTHSIEDAVRAADDGADFLVFGPIYDTPSKRHYGRPVGLNLLSRVCRRVAVPVYAVGGITANTVGEVMAAGANGAAIISYIMSSRDIVSAARRCCEAVSRAKDGSFG